MCLTLEWKEGSFASVIALLLSHSSGVGEDCPKESPSSKDCSQMISLTDSDAAMYLDSQEGVERVVGCWHW
jgi:hypothetical protein